jgi:hypothetical protein
LEDYLTMEKDTQMEPEFEIVDDEVLELDGGEVQETGTDAQPKPDKPDRSGGDLKIALQQERKKRREAQELLQAYLQGQVAQGKQQPTAETDDPVMKAIADIEGKEEQSEIAKVLKAMYSKVAGPNDSVMELQLDRICDEYPGAADHRSDILATAKRYGIGVEEAYFMRYGKEVVGASKEDLLREAELQNAAKQNSTARVDASGNVAPEPVKKNQTIRITRSEHDQMRKAGITPQQYAKAIAHQGPFPIDVLQSIYGSQGGVKKG